MNMGPTDVVVTVPKGLWQPWLEEGDLPGTPWSRTNWSFYLGGSTPTTIAYLGDYDPKKSWAESQVRPADGQLPTGESDPTLTRATEEMVWERREEGSVWRLVRPGQRCYVVAHGRLRGYSPLYAVEVDETGRRLIAFIRRGGAVALTLPSPIRGFRGWRHRWWQRPQEQPFPDWQTLGVS
jgi:hypothetical protein